MIFRKYLKINDETLPMPDSYDIMLKTIEADSGGETEAGTVQRDIVRTGIAEISVSFSVTPEWLKKLAGFSKEGKLNAEFLETETMEFKQADMYITDFTAKLMHSTSFKGLWEVSFKLKEY